MSDFGSQCSVVIVANKLNQNCLNFKLVLDKCIIFQ